MLELLSAAFDPQPLSAELLAVVETTMQPTQTSMWLRPGPPARP